MPSSFTDIIRQCPLLAKIHDSRCARLAEFSQLRKYHKGQNIFREGDPAAGIFIVATGMVRVFKIGPSGKEHVLHIATPYNTFAEVAAIGNFDCPANAEAIANSSCVVIPADLFRRQMETDHQFCFEMVQGMSFWVHHLVELLGDIVLRDAAGRVARYLLESEMSDDGTVQLPGLKRHVASHLNLTSETFSRTLGRMIEAGLVIDLENSRVRILDEPGLQSVSEGLFPRH